MKDKEGMNLERGRGLTLATISYQSVRFLKWVGGSLPDVWKEKEEERMVSRMNG